LFYFSSTASTACKYRAQSFSSEYYIRNQSDNEADRNGNRAQHDRDGPLRPSKPRDSKRPPANKCNQDLAPNHDGADGNEKPVAPYPSKDIKLVVELTITIRR
jgi:hypothetical protein